MVWTPSIPPILAAAIALGGCDYDPDVREITEQRVVGGTLRLGFDSATRFGYTKPAPQRKLLEWRCPDGWTELPPTRFRLANFRAPGGVQCYLSVLPGAAGGVLMNLNRWRDQVQASAIGEAEVPRLPRLPMLGGSAVRMDVDGSEGNAPIRLFGLVLATEDSTVFVKMLGPPAAVAAQERSFRAFVASVRRAGEQPALRWRVPAGWQVGSPRKMRAVTIHPPERSDIECYVTILDQAGGGAVPNINRWREQLGLPATDAAAVARLPKRRVLGRPATLVELQSETQGLLGAICQLTGRTVFVKMVGPRGALRGAKAGFFEFIDSLEE